MLQELIYRIQFMQKMYAAFHQKDCDMEVQMIFFCQNKILHQTRVGLPVPSFKSVLTYAIADILQLT